MRKVRVVVSLTWLMVVNLALCARLDAGLATHGAEAARLSRTKQGESVRKVSRERGRRLESLLRPSDDVVEVIDEQPYGLAPPPPPPGYPGYGKPELQRRVEAAPFVALVRIEKLEGELTASGDWVRTTAHCKVSQLFKALPELNFAAGGVTLKAVGGEVRIGRQRVRARHHSASFLATGAEYLVFALPIEAGDRYAGGALETGTWYHVEGNELASVATGERHEAASLLADIAKYVLAERP